jgi:hypothetical protein
MKNRAVKYLINSQVLFLATLMACFFIRPDVLLDNRAISMYGSESATAIPYVLGFLGSGYLILKAAISMPKDTRTNQTLSKCLVALSILLVGLTITPYTLNQALFYIHAAFAFSLFLFELILGLWLVLKTRKDVIDGVLFTVQAIGFVISTLSLDGIKVLNLLVVGQLIAIWMFALLLTRAVYRIEVTDN